MKKFDVKKLIFIYLLVFSFIGVIYLMQSEVGRAQGEFDDYTVMTASLLNDKNFTISNADIEYAKSLFPRWAYFYENYAQFSPYQALNGDALAWYAPTYSLFCIPFVGLLKIMLITPEYGFLLANLFILCTALFLVYRKLEIHDGMKFILILALSINPILLLLDWAGAEVFIYSALIISVTYWTEREYNKAALFCAIAGTMNIVVMVWGMVMIMWFLKEIYQKREVGDNVIVCFAKKAKQILLYGSCYIIGILPCLYNYSQIGYINLSGAGMSDFNIYSIMSRFLAYLFDLNFGFFPYFTVILLLDILIIIKSVFQKRFSRHLALFISMCGIMFGYSIMFHINCGMDGIARYNAWNSVFLIFTAVYGVHELFENKKVKNFLMTLITIGIFGTFLVTQSVFHCSYIEWLPVASYVLDTFPHLYNPLYSTFNSRTSHIDGGYTYECPIVYFDKAGYARKVLVDEESISEVKNRLRGNEEDLLWLESKLNDVTHEQYISIDKSHRLREVRNVIEDKAIIWLSGDAWNGTEYITEGISGNEKNWTWSEGNNLSFGLLLGEPNRKYKVSIYIEFVFNGHQDIIFYNNGENVYSANVLGTSVVEIPVIADTQGLLDMQIILPDAISPFDLYHADDERDLALGLSKIVISKEE